MEIFISRTNLNGNIDFSNKFSLETFTFATKLAVKLYLVTKFKIRGSARPVFHTPFQRVNMTTLIF
jgi:hypothetical protein